ncbi:unnamed protein product [Gongylonema pulchrum]|uniref:G-patch domain-containing protein n=1 Tax=Gongylonema pulchrum TaxID=637853 RepID=A0A183F1I3_9BILA|nr:unnamed protein product [Gongylonema pulchrum]
MEAVSPSSRLFGNPPESQFPASTGHPDAPVWAGGARLDSPIIEDRDHNIQKLLTDAASDALGGMGIQRGIGVGATESGVTVSARLVGSGGAAEICERPGEGDGNAGCLDGFISGAVIGEIGRASSSPNGKRSESLRKSGRLEKSFIKEGTERNQITKKTSWDCESLLSSKHGRCE